jgi:hypothetical protein
MQERTFSLLAPTRAAIALLWAVALVVAVGDRIPTTASDVTLAAALLLSAYPLIDAVSSFVQARWVNGAISTLAAAALAVATFGGDAGAALVVFGAWAVVSGAIQFRGALGRRQWPMIISGGLSTLAGLSFVAASAQEEANLTMLAGYAAVGAVLYLVWTARRRSIRRSLVAQ